MSRLVVLKELREHLLSHWEVAEDWKMDREANDGTPCFMRWASSIPHMVISEYRYHNGLRSVALIQEPSDCLRHLQEGGKEACLLWMDREIAKMQEHDVDTSDNQKRVPILVGA